MDYAALRSEIQADPVAMGYAPLVASGSDGALADLLNSLTSRGAATITLDRVERDNVLPLALVMTKNAVLLADANKRTRWLQSAMIFTAADSIPSSQAQVVATFTDAVADGVLTQAQANGLRQRTGSRAEVLFGPGTIVSGNDVYRALRG